MRVAEHEATYLRVIVPFWTAAEMYQFKEDEKSKVANEYDSDVDHTKGHQARTFQWRLFSEEPEHVHAKSSVSPNGVPSSSLRAYRFPMEVFESSTRE